MGSTFLIRDRKAIPSVKKWLIQPMSCPELARAVCSQFMK